MQDELKTTSDDEPHVDPSLGLYRIYCLLTVVLYPGWSVYLKLTMPDEYDSPVGRTVLALGFLLIYMSSYWSPLVRAKIAAMVHTAFCVVAIHFFWLVYKSNVSSVYVFGSLIVAVCYSSAFPKRTPLLIYSVLLVVLAVAACVSTTAPLSSKLMLGAGILTTQLVALFGITLRLRTIENWEIEKTQTLRLKQQLMERELEAAEAVQKTLLMRLPEIPGVEMKSYYRAASKMGGDWYGHHHDTRTNVFYFWIGDVTGHGVSSSLVTGVACGALYSGEKRVERIRADWPIEERLVDMAEVVNEVIFETSGNMLMTMLFCALDLNNGNFVFVNAGHNWPFLVAKGAKGNQAIQINNAGNPLGHARKLKLRVFQKILNPGDTLFFYTDGLIENANLEGQVFHKARLRALLESSEGAAEAVERMTEATEKIWQDDPLKDDVTMVAMTWQGTAVSQRRAS